LRSLVDETGHLDVEFGDAAGVMGGQDDADPVVDVRPFRMVIHLVGHQGDAGHEAEGGVEILEDQGAGNGRTRIVRAAPQRQPGQSFRNVNRHLRHFLFLASFRPSPPKVRHKSGSRQRNAVRSFGVIERRHSTERSHGQSLDRLAGSRRPQADRAASDGKAFDQGQMLYDAGEAVDEVWFPLRGVVSLMTMLPDDKMIETAAIGREGLVGVTCGPMNARAFSRAISQSEGVAACLPNDIFSDALGKSEAMRMSLAKFTEGLFAQVQQTAACNAQHRLDERLARWLLTIHDRSDGDRFELTQPTSPACWACAAPRSARSAPCWRAST
jgi:CRP-like cAMP-binding protein